MYDLSLCLSFYYWLSQIWVQLELKELWENTASSYIYFLQKSNDSYEDLTDQR